MAETTTTTPTTPPPPPDPISIPLANGTILSYSILNSYITIDNPGETVVTINGNVNLTVSGLTSTTVAGDYTLKVGGNYKVTVEGTTTEDLHTKVVTINGNLDQTIQGSNKSTSGNLDQKIQGSNKFVAGSNTVTIQGSNNFTCLGVTSEIYQDYTRTSANTTETVTKNLDLTVNEDFNESIKGSSSLTVQGTRKNTFNSLDEEVQTTSSKLIKGSSTTTIESDRVDTVKGNSKVRVVGDVTECYERNRKTHLRGKSRSTSTGQVFTTTESLLPPCEAEANIPALEFPSIPKMPKWPGVLDGQPNEE